MRLLLVITVLFLWNISANATHLAGGHFEYECLGGRNYLIRLTIFRDCSGIEVDPSFYTLQRRSVGCGVATCEDVGLMTLVSVEGVEHPCAPLGCDDPIPPALPMVPHFDKYVFELNTTLPTGCDEWEFSIILNNRNFVDYMNSGAYFNYLYINASNGVCNNSPIFNDMSIYLANLNTYSVFENSYTETDGDQLVFELVTPLDGNGLDCQGYNILYVGTNVNYLNPFPSVGYPFDINSSNGQLGFVPAQPGTSYFALKVSEYRSGVLISETIRDGEIIAINYPSPPITFGGWEGSSDFNLTTQRFSDDCHQVQVSSPAGSIEDITVTGLPAFVTYTVSGINSSSVSINFCIDYSLIPSDCAPLKFDFNISGTTGNCLFTDAGGANYSITILGSEYCAENKYITKISPTEGYIPPLVQASNTIYIGNSMPPASGLTAFQMGDVEWTTDPVQLIAGNQILTSCTGGGTACVTLHPGSTLSIVPNNCNQHCSPPEPLQVKSNEQFDCWNERLQIVINNGTPPYTVHVTNDLDNSEISNTYLGTFFGAYFYEADVGYIAQSQYTTSPVPYTITVVDADFNQWIYSDFISPTNRFYQPITNNMHYFNEGEGYAGCPVGFLHEGYYYNAQQVITDLIPFVIEDGINTSPPWYGATEISLVIEAVHGLGNIEILKDEVYSITSNDWSLDNKEVYWAGYKTDGTCPYEFQGFGYTLVAKNCVSENSETDCIILDQCYEGDWSDSIIVAKSASDDVTYRYDGRIEAPLGLNEADINGLCGFYPNPSSGRIEFFTSPGVDIQRIRIYQMTGSLVYDVQFSNQAVNLDNLQSGAYSVEIQTNYGVKKEILIVL